MRSYLLAKRCGTRSLRIDIDPKLESLRAELKEAKFRNSPEGIAKTKKEEEERLRKEEEKRLAEIEERKKHHAFLRSSIKKACLISGTEFLKGCYSNEASLDSKNSFDGVHISCGDWSIKNS